MTPAEKLREQGAWSPRTVNAFLAVVEAAGLIQAYDQAGGNEWWEAHAKLYAALAALADALEAE